MDALAFTEVLNFKKLGQLAYVMKSNYSLFFICNSSLTECPVFYLAALDLDNGQQWMLT